MIKNSINLTTEITNKNLITLKVSLKIIGKIKANDIFWSYFSDSSRV